MSDFGSLCKLQAAQQLSVAQMCATFGIRSEAVVVASTVDKNANRMASCMEDVVG